MAKRAAPAFELSLGNTILEGLADIGTYDGKHPSLTCATAGGKVFVHCPHERTLPQQDAKKIDNMKPNALGAPIKYLNINRQVTALKAGRLLPSAQHDSLMVGTQTNLLAYNVESNSDIFYKEVQDGINTMVFGRVGSIESPLAIVGGNCSIQGFDHDGQELFWTVTGDNVTALALMDIDGNGQNELLVGSEDYEIRIFKNEEVVTETTETDKVLALHPLRGTRYGYALGNGTVGVYDRHQRAWRFKSKHRVSCVSAHDVDCDGVPEMISGWQNGKVEGRHERTGESLFKDSFPSPVSALVVADYRMDGRSGLVACSYEGLIRGYLPIEKPEEDSTDMDAQLADQIRDLMQIKQNLSHELKQFEENIDKSKKGEQDGGLIPASTKVTCQLKPNGEKQAVELVLKSNPGTTIKLVIVTAEYLFGSNESCVCYASDDTASNSMSVFFAPEKDVGTDLHIKAAVGSNLGDFFHVFELTYALPKFAMYVPLKDTPKKPPEGHVVLAVSERINRVAMWIQQSFNFNYQSERGNRLEARFISLRTHQLLQITMTSEGGGKMEIRVDSIEIAGDIIQDLCTNLKITELHATADFPQEFEEFNKVLQKVDGYNAVRIQLTMEMADSSQLVKALVIRAEDARILNETELMRQHYAKLHELNSHLIGEYIKRANNHVELLAALREVNAMIQKAARLRVGAPKSRVVAECRDAIKSNNIPSLFRIIKLGQLK
eukprot:TRINITY_DN11382_c0_g1_i1.p1 TRINITY_DN11382_c0_g1~~TRINITY_DN11382_c0_g1_i1.p1  ORF type:complete len:748 (+),score=285.65 TRINITY_DN11382_c0_g1_i1:82-2244(+)